MSRIKVIHLELEGQHYYFGSPKAMFDHFGKEELGMNYNSFHSNIHLKEGVPYTNARKGYTIRMATIIQAKTKRNNNLAEVIRAGVKAVKENATPNENVVQTPAATPAPAHAPVTAATPAPATAPVAPATAPVAATAPVTPTASPNTTASPAASEAKKTPEIPVRQKRSKKKDNDVPEQLTLF